MQRPNHHRVYRASSKTTQDSIAPMSSFQVPSLPTSPHLDALDAFLPPRRALSYGVPTQANLVSLWAAAQGVKRIPGTRNGAGRAFVLNMYRSASHNTRSIQYSNNLLDRRHYNTQTQFNTPSPSPNTSPSALPQTAPSTRSMQCAEPRKVGPSISSHSYTEIPRRVWIQA